MNKIEGALVLVMAAFIVWIYTCAAHPYVAFIISCVGFIAILGIILFTLVSFLNLRRRHQ